MSAADSDILRDRDDIQIEEEPAEIDSRLTISDEVNDHEHEQELEHDDQDPDEQRQHQQGDEPTPQTPDDHDAEKSTASPCSVPEPCAFRTPPPPQPQSQLTGSIEVERSCMETRGHVSVKWDITRKNKTSIVIDGYKMTESRAGKDGRVFWRCSKRFCSATAISLGPRLLSVRQVDSRRFHNHPPTGREEFFRGDFGSPGTHTQVTIKWPVTRMSMAAAAAAAAAAASSKSLKRPRGRIQLPSTASSSDDVAGSAAAAGSVDAHDDQVFDEDDRAMMESDCGEDSMASGASVSASAANKRMRHASLGDLASIQQRLNDPLGAAAAAAAAASGGNFEIGRGGGVGGGSAGLQALATAAGLHHHSGNFAPAAHTKQQPSPLISNNSAFRQAFQQAQQQQQQQQPSPQQQQNLLSQHHHLQQQQHHNSRSDGSSLLASLEAQKALLTLALCGGNTGAGGASLSPQQQQQLTASMQPFQSQPQAQPHQQQQQQQQPYNPIFNPPPQQQPSHPSMFSQAAASATDYASPLKEALSQIDNSQLRRQLRRLEGYFRSGIVAASEAIFRHHQSTQMATAAVAERESLRRLFNYIEGLERVQKLTTELA